MGKLLQKIVSGIVPSWLTRIKSSSHAAPKRLLPPPPSHTIHHHDRSGHSRSSENEACAAPAPAIAESMVLPSSIDTLPPPVLLPHTEANMKQTDTNHRHCDDTDDGHLKPTHSHMGARPGLLYAQQEQEKLRIDLPGSKRKSIDTKEGQEEEEGKGKGHRSRKERKRRKREEGLMICELPRSVCKVLGNGKAVVKYSQEPHHALWESMVEMIVGNGLWELESLEFLLFCYLSLNEAHLYSIIQSSFLKVLKDLGRTF